MDDVTGQPLYWSNVFGWACKRSAGRFISTKYRLPQLHTGECEWEEVKPRNKPAKKGTKKPHEKQHHIAN